MNRIRRNLTRSNLKWVARTNLQSWAIQGVLVGLLTVVGVGGLAAMVSAKCASRPPARSEPPTPNRRKSCNANSNPRDTARSSR